jgi:hypothetical protein
LGAYKKRIYEYALGPAPPLPPTGTASALARVERLAFEPHPEALRVIRVGEAEDNLVDVGGAHRRVARSEREQAARKGQHFPVTRDHYIGANGDPVRPLPGQTRTG